DASPSGSGSDSTSGSGSGKKIGGSSSIRSGSSISGSSLGSSSGSSNSSNGNGDSIGSSSIGSNSANGSSGGSSNSNGPAGDVTVNTRQLYGGVGGGSQPIQLAASSPSPGAASAVQGKGVGLMIDPASLQNLTSSDVLWGLYRMYNSRTDGHSIHGAEGNEDTATDDYDSDVYGSTAVDIPQAPEKAGGVDLGLVRRLRHGANG
ncbi:hypothetical protein Vretifemale_4917, partial [Volvox reticuliferus]